MLALLTLASFEAVNTLGVAAQNLQAALPAAQRLFSLADQTPAVRDPPQPLPAPQALALAVRDLHFSYREGRAEALAGISFDLPPGKHVALVGLSGAGKSTLLGLLLRFWDIPRGAILLNGRDLRNYAARDVRARLAVVPQESRLLAGSLRQNLWLARPGASDRELLEALGRARLLPWLANLPRG